MKKIYVTPNCEVVAIETEQTILTGSTNSGITVDRGSGSTITDESGFGTNKKQHPIWGEEETDSHW